MKRYLVLYKLAPARTAEDYRNVIASIEASFGRQFVRRKLDRVVSIRSNLDRDGVVLLLDTAKCFKKGDKVIVLPIPRRGLWRGFTGDLESWSEEEL